MTDGLLKGAVALVTGASRGAGRGAALGLGEAGAHVYLTGRTMVPGSGTLAGSLPETAADVVRLGGTATAVACDHANDAEVEAVMRRIADEQGRLDVLVNNVYASPTIKTAGVPFWDLPQAYWDDLHAIGLRSHYVASRLAAPVMVRQGRGLIVNISSSAAGDYSALFGVAHGVAKAALDRMTADMARELQPHGVAVVSLWPGPIKGEKVTAQPPRLAPELIAFILKHGESPHFIGRAIAALAADPQVMGKTGKVFKTSELAAEYGFSDPDAPSAG